MEGNTVWVLASAALVLFMSPGLAFFYGGMVRSKNVLGMLMQNFFSMGLVSVLWALFVFSIAFGGTGKFLGDFNLVGLKTLGDVKSVIPAYAGKYALVVPPLAFVAFQLMFAIITPALITGAIADRMKFRAWVVFLGAWLVLVYAPIAHWVFAPVGWLFQLGALDFAGGTVVHINAGIAALAVVLVLGRRKGWPGEQMPPHSLPFTLLGTGMLWFGSGRQRPGRPGLPQHQQRGGGGHAGLAGRRTAQGGPRHDVGRGLGRGGRPRGHHALRRLRRRDLPARHRLHRRRGVLLGHPAQVQVRLRRRPRRRRRPPGRGDRRVAPPRPVRRARGQPGLRRRWPIVRRRIGIARQTGGRRRGHHRLVGRDLLCSGQGHLGDHRAPGHPRRGGPGTRSHPARRDGLLVR